MKTLAEYLDDLDQDELAQELKRLQAIAVVLGYTDSSLFLARIYRQLREWEPGPR